MAADDSIFQGRSEIWLAFWAQLEAVAQSDATVLLGGESGAGKEVAARGLHALSERRAGPFVAVHLGALSSSLVESELFGHVRGAFTDARSDRQGCFQRADGGTLVLDDIDLLPREAQVKLLRVLQERVVEPLGGEGPIPVDVRVVATSSADLNERIDAGALREDLYYRLSVVPLEVPPLRSRVEDVVPLAEQRMRVLARRLGVEPRSLDPAAAERLRAHPWPGNVRELENALERVLVLRPGASQEGGTPAVGAEELAFLDEAGEGVVEELARSALAHGLRIQELELAMMDRALEEQRGNMSAAARQVGLTRRAFEYRLQHRPEGEALEAAEEAGR